MASPRHPARRGHKHTTTDITDLLTADLAITGDWSFDANLTMATSNVVFDSGYGIRAQESTDAVNVDVNALPLDGTSDATFRINRACNTTGTARAFFYNGDGTSSLFAALQYDNTAGLGTIEARNAAHFYAYSSGNTKKLDISHNNTNAKYVLGSSDGAHSFEVNDTNVLTIDTDDVRVVNGKILKATDSAENDSIGLQHDGANGIIWCPDRTSSHKGVYITGETSTGVNGGIYQQQSAIAADDDTVTITIPNGMDGGFVFLVAQSTSAAETGQHGAVFYFANTTMIPMFTHTNWSFGSGSNPDVDGDHNVWRSGEATISIKNRRGTARYYNAFVICGE